MKPRMICNYNVRARKTFSTDCCEVRDEICSDNVAYLNELKKYLRSKNVAPPIHIAVKRGHFDCVDAIIM